MSENDVHRGCNEHTYQRKGCAQCRYRGILVDRLDQAEARAKRLEEERDFYRAGMFDFRTQAYGCAPLGSLVALDDKYLARIEAEELEAFTKKNPPSSTEGRDGS